jgi:ABC-2 type transport system permease protein
MREYMGKEREKLTLAQGCAAFIALYLIAAIALYFIAGDQFKYKKSTESIINTEATTPVGELQKGNFVEQTFIANTDTIDNISLKFATYARQNTGTVRVQLLVDSNKEILMDHQLDVAQLIDNSFVILKAEKPSNSVKGKILRLSISSETGSPGNAVTLWYNDRTSDPDQELIINGQPAPGVLCFTTEGSTVLLFGKYYFAIIIAIGLLLTLYCLWLIRCQKTGKKSVGLNVLNAFGRYGFLLKQLVSRDFKTKYKRSVLGILWSFLNPLLTMIVQYIVFSTIFKTNIPNFAVYLLVGIIFFNFFAEATSMGLMAIVGNSSLITKVYIPKYIFPVSKVLSSAINLLISMVPLIIMVLVTSVKITKAILLLPFSIICTIIFCIGMSFILSSAMVYFRDTQFLWNIISMLWMYATPIFYPESILPQQLMPLFKLNPLYHFIRFSREIILAGVSPEPQAYLFCIIASIVPFVLGVVVFKKAQDRFVLKI